MVLSSLSCVHWLLVQHLPDLHLSSCQDFIATAYCNNRNVMSRGDVLSQVAEMCSVMRNCMRGISIQLTFTFIVLGPTGGQQTVSVNESLCNVWYSSKHACEKYTCKLLPRQIKIRIMKNSWCSSHMHSVPHINSPITQNATSLWIYMGQVCP